MPDSNPEGPLWRRYSNCPFCQTVLTTGKGTITGQISRFNALFLFFGGQDADIYCTLSIHISLAVIWNSAYNLEMSAQFDDLEKRARALSREEKAALARVLID